MIHKHLFVFCVCVSLFFHSKINFAGQHKPHSRLKKMLHRIQNMDTTKEHRIHLYLFLGVYTRFAWAGGTFFPVVLLCQFLVLAGIWQFFCCGGKFLLRPEKKDTVVCLAGARSLLRPEKKDTVVCLLSDSRLSLVAIVIFVLVQLELNLIQIHLTTSIYPLHIRSIHTIHVIQIIPH